MFERENFFLPLYIHPSIHPSIHPPSSTDQATRRLPLASQILVGRSISLTSTLGLNSNCQAQVSKISISANRVIFLSTLPRSHTSRSLLHRTFLPRAPPAPGPADCSRPGHGVQVGGFMAIVNKLNQKYMGLALSSVSELGWMKSRNCSPDSVWTRWSSC